MVEPLTRGTDETFSASYMAGAANSLCILAFLPASPSQEMYLLSFRKEYLAAALIAYIDPATSVLTLIDVVFDSGSPL